MRNPVLSLHKMESKSWIVILMLWHYCCKFASLLNEVVVVVVNLEEIAFLLFSNFITWSINPQAIERDMKPEEIMKLWL